MSRKAELLEAIIEDCARNGIGSRSLRDLADAVGTSHRMLIHHFGSRDELLLAIVDEVESQTFAHFEKTGDFAAMWAHVRAPRWRPFERLFFECYARGAQGESPFVQMLPGAVDRWTDGTPEVRLGLAVMRGLLLDLVGTNDRGAVDEAARLYDTMQRRSVRERAARSIGLDK